MVFLSRSTQQSATIKWFKEHFTAELKKAGCKSHHDTPFNILGVGCGDGSGGDFPILDFAAHHLAHVGSKQPLIFYRAIEPLSGFLEIFKDSAQKWRQENKTARVSFDWVLGTWEEYQVDFKQEPNSKKFHLIQNSTQLYGEQVG